MYFTDAGYSNTQFDPYQLREKAQELAEVIPKAMQATGAAAIVVTGKSGLSLAFATLMLIDFPLVVVRKRGENSHGNNIEGTPGVYVRRYLILDDFVASGETVRTIVREMSDYAVANGWNGADCVGVLQYLRECTQADVRTDYGDIPVRGMQSYD